MLKNSITKKIIFIFFVCFLAQLVSAKDVKKKVACVGNSVTYGYLVEDREKNCYPAQLQVMLGDSYEVGNFGKSGATLLTKGHRPYTEQEEYKKALSFNPDMVIIALGLNDTDPRNWPNYRDEFFQDYLNLIDSFRQQNPNVQIWICRMSPVTYQHQRFISGTRDWYKEIQETIESIANHANVGLIDLEKPLFSRLDLYVDSLHPNAEGDAVIAQTVYSALTGDYGGLSVPAIYTDNMVLQRDTPLKIQGTADAGETIQIDLSGRIYQTLTKSDGTWSIIIDPVKGGDIYTLKISSPRKGLVFKNVRGGDVWLCSGQSNMAFKLNQDADYKNINKIPNNKDIYIYDLEPRWETYDVEWSPEVLDSINRLEYFSSSSWIKCNAEIAPNISAIAYYFSQMLADSTNIPIGIIINAVGGSAIESWIDRETLQFEFPELMTDWTRNDFIQDWVRGRALKNIKQGKKVGQRHPYEPCYLFEAGIEPLAQYPIKGVLWYQGESNAHNYDAFRKLFPLFIDSWRQYWNNEELPFYYVQLSSLNRPSWAWFRDVQRELMHDVKDSYMAVSSDRGDSLDVHPRFKKDVAERLGRWVLNKEYEKANIVPSGPLFKNAFAISDTLVVSFDFGMGMKPTSGTEFIGFEVAEVDGLYFPAEVESRGNGSLKVWSDKVNNPKYIRYGWQPFTRANLVNADNLPASTFKYQLKHTKKMNKQKIQELPNYPITGGVSAPFVGVINNKLIAAGGCNFPQENQPKKFYDEIYVLDLMNIGKGWIKAGTLDQPNAYGAYITNGEALYCIGGSNEKGDIKDVFKLSFDAKGKLKKEKLATLPTSAVNAGATVLNNNIYLVGGSGTDGIFYSLDLANPKNKWQEVKTNLHQQRQQPVVFSVDGNLYMGGGYDETSWKALDDMYKFNFESNKWEIFTKIMVDNKPSTFIGASAVVDASSNVFFVGGVNYEIFNNALKELQKRAEASKRGEEKVVDQLKKEWATYMNHPIEWYKFNNKLLTLNDSKFVDLYESDIFAKAGAGVTCSGNNIFVICGELKPGKRSDKSYWIILD